jgi:hypothetical protein
VRALEDYKDLADDAALLKAELKLSQSALASERSRVERWDDTICDLKDEIEALKWPQSTVSATTSLTRPIAQSSRTTGRSSRLTAPLPARAHSRLAAWISNTGLASRIEAHPKADSFDNPPGDFANNVPDLDMSMPPGWEDDNPNWGSDASVWDGLEGPDNIKASSKKRKKWAHNSEPPLHSLAAVHEKATREYLVRSSARL